VLAGPIAAAAARALGRLNNARRWPQRRSGIDWLAAPPTQRDATAERADPLLRAFVEAWAADRPWPAFAIGGRRTRAYVPAAANMGRSFPGPTSLGRGTVIVVVVVVVVFVGPFGRARVTC